MDRCLKYKCQIGATSIAHSFRKWAGTLSGPVTLDKSNSFSKLRTPLISTEMVAILGKCVSEIIGEGSDECGVKTEVK